LARRQAENLCLFDRELACAIDPNRGGGKGQAPAR
jgi:hypothetical protein